MNLLVWSVLGVLVLLLVFLTLSAIRVVQQVEKNSTIIFPLPIDLVEPMLQMMRRQTSVSVRESLNGSRSNEPSLPRSQ